MKYFWGVIFLCISHAAVSQEHALRETRVKNIYLRATIGYGTTCKGKIAILENSSYAFFTNGSYNLPLGSPSISNNNPASYGAGGSFALTCGYTITNHIEAELSAYAVAIPKKFSYTMDLNTPTSRYGYRYESKARLPLYFIPSIVISTNEKRNFYMRLGVVLPVNDEITYSCREVGIVSPNSISFVVTETGYTLTQKFGLGLQTALGLSYPISDKWSIFTELSGIFRNAYANHLTRTKYVFDGNDLLDEMTTYQLHTDFKFGYGQQNIVNPDQPNEEMTSDIPFSSFGGSIGCKLNL